MDSTTTRLDLLTKVDALQENLAKVIRGKAETTRQIIIALLAEGSVLLEDVPGVGKTTLAKALANSLALKFRRVQCTPDLLPADILGFSVFQPHTGEFQFRPGPVFCNILLVDEINRASPRTQSALLEAMGERQVTIEGELHELPEPFLVIATQNPLGYQGTFPLPEAQLDRFFMQLALDYPDEQSEIEILFDQIDSHPVDEIQEVMPQDDLRACQKIVRETTVARSVAGYIIELVRKTREDPRLKLGASPRASLMMFRAAQAAAFFSKREFVLPDDVQEIAPLVLRHRVALVRSQQLAGLATAEVIRDIVSNTPVPV